MIDSDLSSDDESDLNLFINYKLRRKENKAPPNTHPSFVAVSDLELADGVVETGRSGIPVPLFSKGFLSPSITGKPGSSGLA